MEKIPDIFKPLINIMKAYDTVEEFVRDYIQGREELLIVKGRYGVSKIFRGTLYDVDITKAIKGVGGKLVASLHSHPGNFSFSLTDLIAFLYHPHEKEIYLLTPTKIYHMVKPKSLIGLNIDQYLLVVNQLINKIKKMNDDMAIKVLIENGFTYEIYSIKDLFDLVKKSIYMQRSYQETGTYR